MSISNNVYDPYNFSPADKPLTECLIFDIYTKQLSRHVYDACSGNALAGAVKYYEKRFRYIGSGKVIYINGKNYPTDKPHHFFVENNIKETNRLTHTFRKGAICANLIIS
jgi:hypothetical protein